MDPGSASPLSEGLPALPPKLDSRETSDIWAKDNPQFGENITFDGAQFCSAFKNLEVHLKHASGSDVRGKSLVEEMHFYTLY